MQEHTKVYPSGHAPLWWLGWLLMILTVLVILTGLISRKEASGTITPLPTATPYPFTEEFDETMETCQWALPQVEWYALQLGAFDNQQAAETMGEQYRKRGAAGYLWQDERYRVLAAIYASDADARNVRQQISEQHQVDSYLYRICLQPIEVSLYGMRGQIEIIQAGFKHAADLISSLQEISILSDRSELTREEQQKQLTALNDQLQLVKLRLYQRFPEPRNACITGLIALFDDFERFTSKVNAAKTQVLFGAELKYQTLRSLDLLRQVYDILGNT